MSEAAKAARSAMKDKIKRLLQPLKGKVDASDYGPEEVLGADVKTGMRPISRRAYKSGGKVEGSCGPMRADRKPRKSGGKAITANSLMNRDAKEANEEREGKKHVGALARGGSAKGLKIVYSDDRSRTERDIDRENALRDLSEQMDRHAENEDWDKHDAAQAEYNKISKNKNYMPPHRRYENGLKTGGVVKSDKAQDKALIKKALRQHETAEHGGKHSPLKLKRGGDADGKWIQGAIKHPGSLRKSLHVKEGQNIPASKLKKAEHSENPKLAKRARLAETLRGINKKDGGCVSDGEYQGTRPTGGRLARASGGKTGKGKMNVNIVISTGPKGQGPQPGMPGGPLGVAPPPVPVPPPAAPPPALPPMPVGGPPGAAGGAPMGGLPPLPRKSGGKVGHRTYRSYKDMDAGSGGGLGRLEKTEIQEHKG